MSATESGTADAGLLPPGTRMGPAEMIVTDLDRALAFYAGPLGMSVGDRGERTATLGDGTAEVLVLVERPDARPAGRHAGLYHVALLLPSRAELARVARRIAEARTPIEGVADHRTHEAIYLPDPDGNGIELAADRPREEWPDVRDLGYLRDGVLPLDVRGLLESVAGEPPSERIAPGLSVGHVHLHVGDVEASAAFYRDVVGLELMLDLAPSAAFLAAGGYHHHVAVNSWRGRGVPPVPPDAVGLGHATLLVPSAEDLDGVRARARSAGAPLEDRGGEDLLLRDPSGNTLLVRAGALGA